MENPEEEPTTMETVAMRHFPSGTVAPDLAHVLVETGSSHAARHALSPPTMLIGRRSTCAIRLLHSKVSSEHGRLVFNQAQWHVVDLNSTNGTFLNGVRLKPGVETELPVGSILQVGNVQLMYQVRSAREAESENDLQDDLARAVGYISELLPPALMQEALVVASLYHPCAVLGGDAYGYWWLKEDLLAFYLLDVSGHGVEAALHASAVMNILNGQSLPQVDFSCPDQVLEGLNRVFRMVDHAGKYFTIWYGVYSTTNRQLAYAGGGHPAAFLVDDEQGTIRPLPSDNPGVGVVPHASFTAQTTILPPDARLILYSDGVFECVHDEEGEWSWESLADALVAHPSVLTGTPEDLLQFIQASCGTRQMDDDFTVVQLRMPGGR
ncbi:MAG: serine phosphatase RsbU (regulator of sigma subunit) [Candidatus Omnitrophota bacterium]|jgi:serine phosphatase RsbU (regulator of sigma subunit)